MGMSQVSDLVVLSLFVIEMLNLELCGSDLASAKLQLS